MKNRILILWHLLLAIGSRCTRSLAAPLSSRLKRQPDCVSVRAPGRSYFALALNACLLVGLFGWQSGHARPANRTETLRVRYALNQPVNNLDGAQMRRKLLRLLSMPIFKEFLETVKEAEGGEPNLMVGGCRAKNLKQHPALVLPFRCRYRILVNGEWLFSSASGNYQITLTNWRQLASFLQLQDFSETSQALAALELIRRGGGAAYATTLGGMAIKRRIQRGFLALLKGDVDSALCLATYDWASSTCSPLPAGIKINYQKLAAARRKKRGRALPDKCPRTGKRPRKGATSL